MAKEPTPGEGQPFPNLGDVPNRPTSVTPADERKKITDSLVADRNNAHYVDEPAPPRVVPLPGAEVTAAPRPPVSSEPAAPPQYTAQASPPPSAPPPARVAPTPAPPPAASPSPSSQPAVPGAPRSLGTLIVGPGGEIKGATVGDGSPLPNSAIDMSAMSTSGYVGPMPVAVVLFNDNATQISPEQRQGLTAVAREASAHGGTIRVVGHASPAKDANSSTALINNLRAAQDRAQSVASALTGLGVPSSQIQVDAATSADSLPDIASVPSGAAGMRRADIFLQ
jgi:outer membrane protein OmpA-like peptidoglycan-associated protein